VQSNIRLCSRIRPSFSRLPLQIRRIDRRDRDAAGTGEARAPAACRFSMIFASRLARAFEHRAIFDQGFL